MVPEEGHLSMKILFINPYYLPYRGGIEKVIEKLSKEYLPDHKVGVLTTKYEFPRKYRADWLSFEEINGTSIYRLESFPKKALPFYQVPLVWFSPTEVKKIIADFKPDVIHLMTDKWFWGNFWVWLFSRLQGINRPKIIFSPIFHSLSFGRLSNPLLWLIKQLLRPINIFLTNVVDRVHYVSNFEKDLIKRAYLTKDSKFTIVPWGIDQSKKYKVKSKKEREEVTILCVARLSKHKGQMWLLERYINCHSKFKVATKLVFIGKDIGEGGKIKSKIENLKLQKKVKILGEVSDPELEKWYKKADIFALFPEFETFGLVFIEAMGWGIPVLTHKVGALPEVLKGAATIVDQYNDKQAEEELISLVNNKKGREEKGILSYQYVKDNYSWNKAAEQLLEVYEIIHNNSYKQ